MSLLRCPKLEVGKAPVQDLSGDGAAASDVVTGGPQRHADQGQATPFRLEQQAIFRSLGVTRLDPGRAGVRADQRVGVLPLVGVMPVTGRKPVSTLTDDRPEVRVCVRC